MKNAKRPYLTAGARCDPRMTGMKRGKKGKDYMTALV
jgi:hypothetical protein